MGGIDLLQHPLFLHIRKIGLPVPPHIPFLEVPGIIENIGLPALAVQGGILQLEFPESGGKIIDASGNRRKIKPDGFKAFLCQQRSPKVISLHGTHGNLLFRRKGELHKGIGILGAMLVGQKEALLAVGSRKQRAHESHTPGKGAFLHGHFVQAEAVEHGIEFGKPDFCQGFAFPHLNAAVFQPFPLGFCQAMCSLSPQDVLKFHHR